MINVEFIDSPTEQTTAATDALLAGMALAAAFYLLMIGQAQPWKASLWAWAFGFLALAAALGAVAHGIKMRDAVRKRIWQPLFLSLGLTVALFLVGTIFDLWGLAVARWALPLMIVVGLAFFGTTLLWPNNFFVFVIYEALAMLFALVGYIWLAFEGSLDGAWLMVAGVLVTIFAAGVQASNSISFTFIWQFDHNGAYHLIQMVGILLLVVGLRAALLAG